MQRRICERDDRAQAVVAACELDHHQDVLVGHAFFLRRVDRARECVRHSRIAGCKTRSTGAEDQAGFEKVAALELVDADLPLHLACTYLS